MSQGFIVGNGGTRPFAMILATYPSGSTVTCTNASGKKAIDSTHMLFYIKKLAVPFNCVVSITDGTQTKSETVSITYEGQGENVVMAYSLVLFEDGALNSSYSLGGIAEIDDDYIEVGVGDHGTGVGYIEPEIDCTNYNTLHFIGGQTNIPNAGHNVGIATAVSDWNKNFTAKISNLPNTSVKSSYEERTIDISTLSGSFYFKAGVYSTNVRLTKIWLD